MESLGGREWQLLEERAGRVELLAMLLRSGGMSRVRAVRVLRAELSDLEAGAAECQQGALSAIARALRLVVEELGGQPDSLANVVFETERPGRDVLVLDDNEVTRDLIALALEAEGHRVRVSGGLAQFIELFHERRPDVILTEVRMPRAPEEQFCSFLRQAIRTEHVPIVIFSSAAGPELEALARRAGADLWLSKDQGLNHLIDELNRLFDQISWAGGVRED